MTEDVGRVQWLTISADAVHYVDHGAVTILCDRLPRPLTLILKNPVLLDGAFFPSAVVAEFPTSLADRGGTSAASYSPTGTPDGKGGGGGA